MPELSEILRELRKSEGLSQIELAKKVGLSVHAINSYESGRREPNSKAMAALERYFHVSGDYLRGNLDKESFYENNSHIQSDLDLTYELWVKFQELFSISSQTKQMSATKYLNSTLKNIIENILPDTAPEIDSSQLNSIVTQYFLLNQNGKDELKKRAEELLQLKQYIKSEIH